jgi:hypothetical protein
MFLSKGWSGISARGHVRTATAWRKSQKKPRVGGVTPVGADAFDLLMHLPGTVLHVRLDIRSLRCGGPNRRRWISGRVRAATAGSRWCIDARYPCIA